MQTQIRHPIKVAASRTGLNPHVIRAWEKRYGAVKPDRTASNRRLYTEADIERLRLLRQATSAGHSIGQIASLSAEELDGLLGNSADPSPSFPVPECENIHYGAGGTNGRPSARDFVDRCIAAVQRFDAAALENELARAAVRFGQLHLLEEVIEPLMIRIGELWREGDLRIADEHLASAVIRSFVDGIRAAFPVPASSPHIIVATPNGQLHEIGALMVATQAARGGWRVTYLGSSLPAAEIARIAHANRVSAVALSLVYPEDDPRLAAELVYLRRCLPAATVLLVGGRTARNYRDIIDRIGAVCLPTLSALRPELTRLRRHPAPNGEAREDR